MYNLGQAAPGGRSHHSLESAEILKELMKNKCSLYCNTECKKCKWKKEDECRKKACSCGKENVFWIFLVVFSLGLYCTLSLTFLYRDHGTLSLHLFRMFNFNFVLVRSEL